MLYCAICDDDISIGRTLSNLVKGYSAEFDCKLYSDPLVLLSSVYAGQRFDLYILDIIMPSLTGIDLAHEIRSVNEDCIIFFLTSSDEFHREAFEVDALQYLDKPVDKARLYHALDRVRRYIGEKKAAHLPVQTKEGIRTVDRNQIVYVESFRHILTFHMQDGCTVDTLDSSMSLEKLTEMLSFPPFCVPYRGFIVNMDHVECLEKYRLCLTSGNVIPIPQKQFVKVRKQYSDHLLTRYTKGNP